MLQWWKAVKVKTKQFLLESNARDWEQEMFLEENDVAEVRSKQMMQQILNDLEIAVENGTVQNTAAAVLEHFRREAREAQSESPDGQGSGRFRLDSHEGSLTPEGSRAPRERSNSFESPAPA